MSAVLDIALIERARAQSRKSQRSVIAELEAICGLEPRQLMQELAKPFGLTVMETAEMLARAPAFDLLPLAHALQRHCVLLRCPEGTLTGVVPDPFDLDLQEWLSAHAGATAARPLHLRLALKADIQAYLSKQEESARAIDSLAKGDGEGGRDGKAAAVLSFASVSEAASPAVKLVNSTLYDALKAGASDVHLESTATGLAVKYRVDGVLDHVTTVGGV
ncbi:MAG TPA: type II/IV secretion system protein, partial [Telluria sp.]|nr:type II/IV secretion system protein [Telluria sp.]